MVVNDKYKFIFFHIPKAAGTSIMVSLAQLEGNNTELLAKTKHETQAEFFKNWKSRISSETFLANPEEYFRFGFVRNPWSRMFSFYTYLKKARPRREIDTINSFRHFLRESCNSESWINGLHSMRQQVEFCKTADNTLFMDYLGHFEWLENDWQEVLGRIGIEANIGHFNKYSSSFQDYRENYDPEMIKIVAARFKNDIEQFGYIFEDTYPTRRCSGKLNADCILFS